MAGSSDATQQAHGTESLQAPRRYGTPLRSHTTTTPQRRRVVSRPRIKKKDATGKTPPPAPPPFSSSSFSHTHKPLLSLAHPPPTRRGPLPAFARASRPLRATPHALTHTYVIPSPQNPSPPLDGGSPVAAARHPPIVLSAIAATRPAASPDRDHQGAAFPSFCLTTPPANSIFSSSKKLARASSAFHMGAGGRSQGTPCMPDCPLPPPSSSCLPHNVPPMYHRKASTADGREETADGMRVQIQAQKQKETATPPQASVSPSDITTHQTALLLPCRTLPLPPPKKTPYNNRRPSGWA